MERRYARQVSTRMKYCPNAECRHRVASGSQAEYLDRIETCADCGAALVLEPGSLIALQPPPSATLDESAETQADLRSQQARQDVRTGVFGILAGLVITFGTIMFPNEHGTSLIAWGPIGYGLYRLIRGLG